MSTLRFASKPESQLSVDFSIKTSAVITNTNLYNLTYADGIIADVTITGFDTQQLPDQRDIVNKDAIMYPTVDGDLGEFPRIE